MGDDAISFLQEITAAHPYFIPAQFFLLQQFQEDHPAYAKQAARTALLFNNPHWLHYQLTRGAILPARETERANVTSPQLSAVEKEVVLPVTGQPEQAIEENKATIEVIVTGEHAEIPLDIPVEEVAVPVNEEIGAPVNTPVIDTAAMLFEPMHMVDYFASQGIKLSAEAQGGDKLGKQLKSFTEWLKTMKKVNAAAELIGTGGAADTAVQLLAEKSNTEGEVLTESMAEVFAKQGKAVKAREVYEKLSLLNPSKSAYFAARIESLKAI